MNSSAVANVLKEKVMIVSQRGGTCSSSGLSSGGLIDASRLALLDTVEMRA